MLVIAQEIKKRGLTQAKLARKSDVNETSMSRIVNGKEPPFPQRGQRIAAALGWSGDWRRLFEEAEGE